MPKAGDVILAKVQYTDTFEIKKRPALVLYEEMGNIVIAGVTSNTKMKGIPLTKREGAVKDSVIKLNYVFTITEAMVNKTLFRLSQEKRSVVYQAMGRRFSALKD